MLSRWEAKKTNCSPDLLVLLVLFFDEQQPSAAILAGNDGSDGAVVKVEGADKPRRIRRGVSGAG
jgi:hypothetical protein